MPSSLRFIFVCGVSRSGTSMTNGLFDGHPELLALPGESQFLKIAPRIRRFRNAPEQYFLHMMGRPFDFEEGRKLPFGTLVDRDRNWKIYEPWQAILNHSADPIADEERMLSAIRNGKSEGELFLELVDIYRERVEPGNAATTILEKTPGNEFMADRMFRTFEQVKFLHLVRDPFDNLRSRVARRGQIHWEKVNWPGLVNMTYEWRRSLHAGARIHRSRPENHRMVRYEDLVSQPEATLRAICEFLEISFHPNLLRPTKRGGSEAAHTGSHEVEKSRIDLTQITPEGLSNDATEVLGEECCRAVAACLGSDYAALGYTKYARYFEETQQALLWKRYPHETKFHQGLRVMLNGYFAMQDRTLPESLLLNVAEDPDASPSSACALSA